MNGDLNFKLSSNEFVSCVEDVRLILKRQVLLCKSMYIFGGYANYNMPLNEVVSVKIDWRIYETQRYEFCSKY